MAASSFAAADSVRCMVPRPGRRLPGLLSVKVVPATLGKEVTGVSGSRRCKCLPRLLEDADERNEGVEVVLIEARLAIAEVLSFAYAVRERLLLRGTEVTEAVCV